MIVLLMGSLMTSAQDINIGNLKNAKKFDWSGSIAANTNFYHSNGPEQHSNPFNWNLSGNVNFRIMEIFDLPFSFTVGKFQSSYTRPYMQFGISPTYKWAKLHLGNRSLTFNPYTLSGQTFMGVGVELNPKKFRFAAMYGRLKPAVEIDLVSTPSFKRTGYGAKIGYGDESNFIDIMYFHAKDDSSSIQSWKDPELQKLQGDANPLIPAANNVVGVSAKTTLFKTLMIVVDGGISFYDPNLADVDVDPKINQVDLSKKVNWAGKTSISYAVKDHNLRFDYERILPGYITMGSAFFNTDMRNLTFSPSGSFAKGKVNYSLSTGIQRNNLDKKKTETTQRFILNGTLSINPAPVFGIDMNYNNFAIDQEAGTVPLKDSIRLRQVNQTFVVTPHFTIIVDTSAVHSFTLTGNINDVNDRNIVTKEYGNMKAMMLSFNHTSSFTKRGNSINSGLNYNNIKAASGINTQIGATIGYSQAFFQNKLSTTANINWNKSLIDHVSDGSILNGTLTMSLAVGKRQSFSFNYNMVRTASKQFGNYMETTGAIGYNLRLK